MNIKLKIKYYYRTDPTREQIKLELLFKGLKTTELKLKDML